MPDMYLLKGAGADTTAMIHTPTPTPEPTLG